LKLDHDLVKSFAPSHKKRVVSTVGAALRAKNGNKSEENKHAID